MAELPLRYIVIAYDRNGREVGAATRYLRTRGDATMLARQLARRYRKARVYEWSDTRGINTKRGTIEEFPVPIPPRRCRVCKKFPIQPGDRWCPRCGTKVEAADEHV